MLKNILSTYSPDHNYAPDDLLALWTLTGGKEDTTYTRIGSWWDRKGENEIDLVCEDELNRRMRFAEIKRDKRDISLRSLEKKADAFFRKCGNLPSGWSCDYVGLSLEDM